MLLALLSTYQGAASDRTASLDITESADTLSATSALAIQAGLTRTESGDTLTSAAAVAIQATLNRTEAADTLSSASVLAIQATLTRTEAADTLSSGATLAITASLNLTEGADTATGQAVLPIQAAGSTTEAPDTLTSTASLTGGPVVQAESFSGGSYNFLNPRRYKVDDDEEEEQKPAPLEIVKIGEAPQRQVITGLVQPVKKASAKPATKIKSLSTARVAADNERAERIRRNIAASNAWLMSV